MKPVGNPIHCLERRLGRWAEYFKQQFNWPPATSISSVEHNQTWSVDVSPPTEAEVSRELSLVKRYKAPGPDDLSPSLFKFGGPTLIQCLHNLLHLIWTTESVPTEWGTATIVPVYKKGNRNECSNYRGISLISTASKILASILLRRLTPERELNSREEQAGFRRNRGCNDQIFTLRQILELRHEYHRPTVAIFLDIRAAFDSVDRIALWACLSQRGVPEKFINILKAIYATTLGQVRVYGDVSASFNITSGVRQGCPASPFLFNFAIDNVLESALIECETGGIQLLPGSRIWDLEYADDIVLFCENAQSAQQLINRLEMSVRRFGMTFAPAKCKVLLQDWPDPPPVLTMADDPLEVVDQFVYLGSIIRPGGISSEITHRVGKAQAAFTQLRHLWRLRDVSLGLKGRVYNATVRAVLLYGCETWSAKVEDFRRLLVFDHRCLKNIAGVSWDQHVSNASVRHRIFGMNPSSDPIDKTITLRQLRWLGHVLRMHSDRLPKRALFALPDPAWRRLPGGQHLTWRKIMKDRTTRLSRIGRVRIPGWGPRDEPCAWLFALSDMAANRSQWRSCCETLFPSS